MCVKERELGIGWGGFNSNLELQQWRLLVFQSGEANFRFKQEKLLSTPADVAPIVPTNGNGL